MRIGIPIESRPGERLVAATPKTVGKLVGLGPGSVQRTNQFQTSINGIPSTFGGTERARGRDRCRPRRSQRHLQRARADRVARQPGSAWTASRKYRYSSRTIPPSTVKRLRCGHKPDHQIGHQSVPRQCFRVSSGTKRFDANDFFNNSGLPKAKFRLNQFGGNVSGPIFKENCFLLANSEGVRQNAGQTFKP